MYTDKVCLAIEKDLHLNVTVVRSLQNDFLCLIAETFLFLWCMRTKGEIFVCQICLFRISFILQNFDSGCFQSLNTVKINTKSMYWKKNILKLNTYCYTNNKGEGERNLLTSIYIITCLDVLQA